MSFKLGSKDRLADLLAERARLKSQLRAVKDSFSYRLGNMIVEAVTRPGRNTVLMPYRLLKLCSGEIRDRRKSRVIEPAKRKASEVAIQGTQLSDPGRPDARPGLSPHTREHHSAGRSDLPQHRRSIEALFRHADYTGISTRVLPDSDPDLFCARQALNNRIYVWLRLFEPYVYEDEIDWSGHDRVKLWHIYFQSLRVVGYLANATEITGDTRYLSKAGEIIESWFDYHYDNREPPPYTWYDHSVASRTRNVMHFLRAYASCQIKLHDSLFEKIHLLLLQQGTWLVDKKNYKQGNHGMMASLALTQLAFAFPEFADSDVWRAVGIARIKERIRSDVSPEGVHLEHSAFYHPFFLDLVLGAARHLDARGVPLFEPGDETIEMMKRYAAYMVKPDGRLPVVGDSSDNSVTMHYDHPWMMYSLSKGKLGVRPPSTSMVYPDAGVAILRNEWKTGNDFTQTTYLMFQSKLLMPGHKHADDLSLVLYSHDEDIFVGPGVYNSDTSKYRQYVRSAQAHNTLTVDGRSYAISRENIGKAGITVYMLDEAFDFVQGSHTMYDDVTLRRGIVFIRPSTLLVIDEAVSEAEHLTQQIWTLAPAAHDLEFDEIGAQFNVGEDGVTVAMRQLRRTTGVRHYRGQEDPVRGFISPKQRTLAPVHQLEFEAPGRGIVFVTQISVTGRSEEAPAIEVDPHDPYRSIVVLKNDGTALAIKLEAYLQSRGRCGGALFPEITGSTRFGGTPERHTRTGEIDEEAVQKLLAEHGELRGQLTAARGSLSYRLGNMLVGAVAAPGRNTVLLPFGLSRLLVTGAREHRRLCTAKNSGTTQALRVKQEAETGRRQSRHEAGGAFGRHDKRSDEKKASGEYRRFCPICEEWSPRFLEFGVPPRHDALCPHCGALERHRLVWLHFLANTNLFDGTPKKMLHVAPERALEPKFRALLGEGYVTIDLSSRRAMVKMDITSIGCPAETYDIIYCSHVLEHVQDDKKAIRELFRVLKRDGWAILYVPITAERTFEAPAITDPEEKLRVFGHKEHVRRYGPDYADRLREAGFRVQVIKAGDSLNDDEALRMGLCGTTRMLHYCTKQ